MISKQNLIQACSAAKNLIDLNEVMYECGISEYSTKTFHGEIIGVTTRKTQVVERYQEGQIICERFYASNAKPGDVLDGDLVIFNRMINETTQYIAYVPADLVS